MGQCTVRVYLLIGARSQNDLAQAVTHFECKPGHKIHCFLSIPPWGPARTSIALVVSGQFVQSYNADNYNLSPGSQW